jgi:hypothetical protein
MPLLAVLVGTGCGEDPGEEIGTEVLVPSRSGYIAQAEGTCAIYEDRIELLAEERFDIRARDLRVKGNRVVFKPGRRPSDAEIESFGTEVAVPNLRDQLTELRALTQPPGDEARLAAIYDAAERAIDALEADPGVLGDQRAASDLFAESRRLARRYGLGICGL